MKDFQDLLGKGFDEKKILIMECIQMMEKYRVCIQRGKVNLSEDDRKRWEEKYFPKLVQYGEITDDPSAVCCEQRVVLKTNGSFTCTEYFQIMYQLYKRLHQLEVVK